MDESDSKKCTKCGESKPRTSYGKKSASPDGLFPRCKACRKVDDAARYAALPDSEKRARWVRQQELLAGSAERRDARAQRSREHMARRRAADPAAARAAARAWKAANPERVRESRARWAELNPDKLKAAARRSRERNSVKIRAAKFAYHEANAERIRAKVRLWAKNNPERKEELAARTRARRRAQINAVIEPIDTAVLWTGRCAICGDKLDPNLKFPNPKKQVPRPHHPASPRRSPRSEQSSMGLLEL